MLSDEEIRDAQQRLGGIAWLGWCVAFAMSANFILYVIMRSGLLEQQNHVSIFSLFLGVFGVFAPFLIPRKWLISVGLNVFAIPFILLLAFISPIIIYWFFLPVTIICTAYFVLGIFAAARSIIWLPGLRIWKIVLAAAVGIVVGVTFFLWTNTPLNNVYTPEISQLGIGLHDSLLNISISTMISNYGVPSTGIDGILPYHYHYGSHYWFAAIAKTISTLPINVLPAMQQIVVYPLIIYSIGIAINLLSKPKLSTTFAAAIIPFFIINIIEGIGYWIHRAVESYSISIILMCLSVPILVKFKEIRDVKPHTQDLIMAAMLIYFFVLCAVKISAGFLFGILIGYVILRTYKFKRITWIFLLSLTIISYYSINLFMIEDFKMYPESIITFDFLIACWRFVHVLLDHPNWYMHVIFPLFYIVLVLGFWRWSAGNSGQSIIWRESHSFFSVELAILLFLVGNIIGVATLYKTYIYFSEPSFWFVLPLIIWTLLKHVGLKKKIITASKIIIVAFILSGTISICWNIQTLLVNLSRTIETLENRVNYGVLVMHDFRDGYYKITSKERKIFSDHLKKIRSGGTFWDNQFREKMRHDEHYRMIEILRRNTDKETVVFVPPKNKKFWDSNIRYGSFASLAIPATIGVAMLKGLPPPALNNRQFVGEWLYPADAASEDVTDLNLIKRAKKWGMKKIFVFRDMASIENNYVLSVDDL